MNKEYGKSAETLAKTYGWSTGEEYYDYIVESLINGQRRQVRNLFKEMNSECKREFLNNYLENDNLHHIETKEVIIAGLYK